MDTHTPTSQTKAIRHSPAFGQREPGLDHFGVGPQSDNYRLSISGFTGITPTDPFYTYGPLNGLQFSTHDRDNDVWSTGHCALN